MTAPRGWTWSCLASAVAEDKQDPSFGAALPWMLAPAPQCDMITVPTISQHNLTTSLHDTQTGQRTACHEASSILPSISGLKIPRCHGLLFRTTFNRPYHGSPPTNTQHSISPGQ
ncbi:hypothetical protein DL98DRAFT_248836 [Cadophora sp. DSE1049]|nr:hypothetical protein DL98DRAFT_248836 [Cadophora sp. DSE1049]